jgi:hypothetical protein
MPYALGLEPQYKCVLSKSPIPSPGIIMQAKLIFGLEPMGLQFRGLVILLILWAKMIYINDE